MPAMGPILLFGAVGVLGLLAANKSKAAPAGGGTLPPDGSSPPLGEPVFVTGSSGKKWKVQRVSVEGGTAVLDVYATAGAFGPHQEFRVLRYSQVGSDTNSRDFVSSASGIDPSIIRTAIIDFGIRQPGAAPTSSLVESQRSQEAPGMSDALKQAMANAMKLLTVGPDGTIIGPVTADAIRVATETAGRLDAAGFPEAGSALRELIRAAAKKVPPPPKEQQVPLPPSIPQAVQDQINRAIAMERDPAKLRAIVAALKKLPASAERDNAVEMLEAIIVQAEAKRQTDSTLEEVDAVLKSPGVPQVSTSTAPPPLPTAPPAPPITAIPTSVPVPSVPVPQPAPVPKTAIEQAAQAMVMNLRAVQQKAGGIVKNAKGKEDKSLVARLQTLSNGVISPPLTPDGMAGPSALVFAALHGGQTNLPFVMYWPKSATADKVLQYRAALNNLAALRRQQGNLTAAAELEASAARERGQAGIVGTMPA